MTTPSGRADAALRSSARPVLRGGRATVTGLAVAWACFVVSVPLLVAGADSPYEVLPLLPQTLLIVSGTIIVLRAQEHLIGWYLIVPGAFFNYAYLNDEAMSGDAVVGAGAYLVAGLFVLGLYPLLLLLLTFPTGRFPDRASRLVGRVGGGFLLFLTVVDVARINGWLDISWGSVFAAMTYGFSLLAVMGLVLQFRLYSGRSRVERLQIKWFLFAIVGQMLYPLVEALDTSEEVFLVADSLATSLWPVAILFAITRYRLYEIERLISRTLSYVLVVALLAGIAALALAGLTSLLPSQDQLVVAATTVAVVGLFNPLRVRIVAAVDRRFNRTRYVAQQVVEAFGRSVQDETELSALRERLTEVLGATMAPISVGVWLPNEDRPAKA